MSAAGAAATAPPLPATSGPQPNSRSIEVDVGSGELVEFELSQLANAEAEVLEVLSVLSEAPAQTWAVCILELVRLGRLELAEMMVTEGLKVKMQKGDYKGQVPLLLIFANMTLAKARKAPKVLVPEARYDKLPEDTKTKQYYLETAQQMLQQAQALQEKAGERLDIIGFLSRAVLLLGQGQADQALKDLDSILKEQPANLVALMCKARILYTKRDPASALTIFQFVLSQKVDCKPDPRIGIGLCYWVLGSKQQAKTAWRRSLELDPSNWAAELLLGLERVNHAKLPQTSAKERLVAVRDGLQRVGSAFKNSAQTSAGAAIALSTTYATENGDYERALKLAERAMAFADTRAHFLSGANAMARVHHMRGEAADAERFYGLADNESKHASLIADLGVGQVQLLKGEFLAAKHTFEGVARRWPNEPEVQAMFAALLAHAHPGLSDLERAADRVRARATFDRVQQMIDADAKSAAIADTTGGPSSAVSRDVAADEELFIEMAQAWHGESLERAAKAYKSAARARKDAGRPESPALLNNLGALAMLDGDAATAQGFFEDALTKAAGLDGAALSQQKTTILYNLGRAYEGQGMTEEADNAYRQILNVHPEYPEAKVRLAAMALNVQQLEVANNHLKDALTAHPANSELRAYYLYFLVQTASTLAFNASAIKQAIDFAYNTLREHRSDVYTLSAAGWLNYRQGREMKPHAKDAHTDAGMAAFGRERSKYYARAAELYEKALLVDPECSFAAQALAIAVAENALALPGAATNEDSRTRIANARQALGVFQRVRETLMDGSVYVNMGHCYFANDEFERAIESYETALQRFYNGVDWATSLYLARTWYSKANRDGNFSAMQLALRYAQKALHLQPHDKAILFNIAMIQQKAAEMLVSLNVERRTLAELEDGFKHAAHAQTIFLSLAQDRSRNLPYDPRLADQRFRYGLSILRKEGAEAEKQRVWESTAKAQLDMAIAKRAEEKAELERKEEERMVEIRKQADEVKAARLAKQQEVASWVIAEPDDYVEKKSSAPKKRKKAKAGGDVGGSEGEAHSSGQEEEVERPKKKKAKPKKKYVDPDGDDGDTPMGSDGEEKAKSKPKKKAPRKKAILDEDDDEVVEKAPKRGGKKFVSKATISDSDEE